MITEAGNDPKVSALVYVSAFAPDVGQSLATLAASGPPTEGEATQKFIRMRRATSISTPRCFLGRSRQTCRCRSPSPWQHSQLPLSVAAFKAPVNTAAWKDKPTFYLITTEDKVHRTRGPEAIRNQDACADGGGRRQPRLARLPCKGSRRFHRRGRGRRVTIGLPTRSRAGSPTLARGISTPRPSSQTQRSGYSSGQWQYIQ